MISSSCGWDTSRASPPPSRASTMRLPCSWTRYRGTTEDFQSDDVAPDLPLEALLHPAIRPDDDGDGGSVRARLVHGGLVQLGAPLLVFDSVGVPLLEQLDARFAAANRV